MRIHNPLALPALVFALAASLAGQSNQASIGGVVADSQGGVIADSRITATNADTDLTNSTTSNASGLYLLSNLPDSGATSGKASF